MITKSVTKFIKSLQIKKHRIATQMFIVEGAKVVQEVIHSNYEIDYIVATSKFFKPELGNEAKEVFEVSQKQLESLGSLKSNDTALAVVKMKQYEFPGFLANGYSIVLDTINDPGNLGTIIRIADWYGIKTIVANSETTDVYNPKVISASKGSFLRVEYYIADLEELLRNSKMPKYAAMMNGKSIYEEQFAKNGILIMGNEANGISSSLVPFIDHNITIPKVGGAESLNVAMATAIICDNITRFNA